MTASRWPLNGKGNLVMVAAVLAALVLIFQFLGTIPWERKGEVAAAESRLRVEFQREMTSTLGRVEAILDGYDKRLEAMQKDIRELRSKTP